MRRNPFVLALGLILLSGPPAPASPGFDERCRKLLEVVSREKEPSFYGVAARIRTGADSAGAFRMLDSMTTDKGMGGMFYAYTLIGTYLHCRGALPDSLHRKVRAAFRNRTMYRGDTENHWVMYYTGIYLAAQTWPGEPGRAWFNGRSSAENFREAQEWLTRWVRTTATIGQGEFDSPTYMAVFIAPLLVLYDFAADPVMKRRAGMALDLLFADVAVDHLKGNYCGGHSRDYPEDIVNPLGAPMTRVTWLYFGEPAEERWEDARFRPRYRGSWETVFGALGSYRMPPVIERIALDRDRPYVHTETKRVRNIIRFGKDRNPPVYKYMYMTPDYAIGSLQGGILQPIQQHTWDVTWVSDRPNNTLFTLHPFYSGKELAMFFPEEIRFLAAEVDRYHKVYTNPDKWNSSSPYEQTFQHKNTLIVLYDIDSAARHQHIDGFFPKSLDERATEPSGWVACRAGETYIAVHPLAPYAWSEEEADWRLRSLSLRNGVIVEVGSAREDSSFAKFRKTLPAVVLGTVRDGKSPSVAYTTRHGDRMAFRFGGERLLNEVPVRFANYHLYRGPFVNSRRGSGVITLTAGGKTRVLDFNNVTISESERR
jgi:hypothetical protein